jgi:hypothetical protein
MSATSLPQRRAPAAAPARTRPAERELEQETISDHGYLIKILAGVLLGTMMVAILAQLGWAILPVAIAILLAISAAVLHATLRLLNETDEHADELDPS